MKLVYGVIISKMCYAHKVRVIEGIPGWDTSVVTSSTNMFTDCVSIEGSLGTRYSAAHVDAEYARRTLQAAAAGIEFLKFFQKSYMGKARVGHPALSVLK